MTQNLLTTSRMSERMRYLALMVYDDEKSTLPLLYQICNLVLAEEVLAWLIKEGLTGKKFLYWIKEKHEGSLLQAMAYAVAKVKRDLVVAPLIFGKDIT